MPYVNTVFPVAISNAFKPAFTEAAQFWNNVINSGSGGYTFPSATNAAQFCGVSYTYPAGARIRGLDIFALVEPIDGPGSILGSAGPCANLGNFPILGVMRFDSADSQNLLNGGSFGEVIVHEMGHVIGVGTLWSSFVRNPCPNNGRPCTTNPTYVGSNGMQGYADLGGSGAVPVANTGGGGTLNAHWNEGLFENELMTGFLNSGVRNPLSIMTIKSLRDQGYSVNLGAAENYFIPSEFQRPLNTVDLEMFGDITVFDVQDIESLVAAQRSNLRVESTVEAEGAFKGLFLFMMLGFSMLALMMHTLQRNQRKHLKALRSNSPTETPMIPRRK